MIDSSGVAALEKFIHRCYKLGTKVSRLFPQKRSRKYGAGGGSRTHTASGFIYLYGFRRPLRKAPWGAFVKVWGPDYPFTVPWTSGVGAARLVSTPSRSNASGLARDCHCRYPPTLSSSAPPVSRRALKYCLSLPRLAFRIGIQRTRKEVFGAGGGSRTHTALRPTDFECNTCVRNYLLLQRVNYWNSETA